MLVVAVGWQLYELTGSAFDLGLLGLAQFVPDAGADRVRRPCRRPLRPPHHSDAVPDHRGLRRRDPGLCDRDRLARHPCRSTSSSPLVGSARAFEIPTMAAIISTLVPRAVVPSAMAWFASANQTGQIVGPALGGVLYLLGPTTVYGVTIVLWGLGARHARPDARRPRAALDRAVQSSLADGRLPLRAPRPHHSRHLVARHVRGVSRRRDRAAADLRPRHPADRAVGAGPAPRRAGDRRADHVDHSGAPSADVAGRPRAVQRV